ncbi:putative lipase [Hoyosella rhizosphaerae]|uniref:Lipase n=1 Tax=Hoyosella rhizosphaerae TaxID=1755582 RepID=A0A916XHQ7_9ACTN|nr:putative lipase [Hoyosella rhizosphaerae]
MVLTGCTAVDQPQEAHEDAAPSDAGVPRGPYDIAAVATDTRGEILDAEPLHTLLPEVANAAAEAHRVTYRSTSGIDGRPTEVTGAVFIPNGQAPAGGWPIVSFAHGTTGVASQCGPSQHSDLLGQASRIASLLNAGFAVAATDYEGLGAGGGHPYLEPITAAFNTIDMVRAAKNIDASLSNQWAALGISQGGQAAWAAAEAATDYGDGLELVGSVAIAPAADLSPITDGEPPWDLDVFQIALLPYVIAGYQAIEPTASFDDYLRGSLANGFGMVEQCVGTAWFGTALALLTSSPEDIGPFTEAAADGIRDWLTSTALPLDRAEVPLLVLYGDRDTVVPAPWIDRAIERACTGGTEVDARLIAGADHFSIGRAEESNTWLRERFAGAPAESTCPQ